MAVDSPVTPSVDFPELMEYFVAYLAQERQAALETIRAYQSEATAFARACGVQGSSDLCQVTSQQIQSYLGERNRRGYQSSSIGRIISCLHQLGRFLIWRGWCSQTLLTDILRPKVQRRPRPPLSRGDVQRLLSVPLGGEFVNLRRKVIVELIYATGVLKHELVALDLDDLNVAQATVFLRYRRHGATKLPLNQSVIHALQPYLAARAELSHPQKDPAALFLNFSGARFSGHGVSDDLARHAKAAGLRRISSHTLRATYARLKLEQGVSPREVQVKLGLKHLKSMQSYQSKAAVAVKRADNKS